jgi:cytoskeletal protein CcmA (bactofilin family)
MTQNNYKRVRLTFTSRVAAGTTMSGDYSGKANLLVEGVITGDVKVKGAVMVADGGTVKGRVETDYAIIAGAVGGDVVASRNAEVKSTGEVGGNVYARELLIASEGKVEGDVGAAKKHVTTYETKTDVPEENTEG